MKKAKYFINKHSVLAQDAERCHGHNVRVVDLPTAREAIKMAYEAGKKAGILEATPFSPYPNY